MGIGMIITYLAVVSWCAMAYMLPPIAIMLWSRRHRDKTEIIQDHNGWDSDGNEIK